MQAMPIEEAKEEEISHHGVHSPSIRFYLNSAPHESSQHSAVNLSLSLALS
jgi:hypothetical protein